MCALWLKMIGTSDEPWPELKPYDQKHVGFRGRRPSGVRRGDRMVLYAVGGSKRVFALGEVTSEWYECKEGKEEGWPYRVDIALKVNVAPSSGVNADETFTMAGDGEWGRWSSCPARRFPRQQR
jgi:hypothetical protein